MQIFSSCMRERERDQSGGSEKRDELRGCYLNISHLSQLLGNKPSHFFTSILQGRDCLDEAEKRGGNENTPQEDEEPRAKANGGWLGGEMLH